MGQRFDSLTIIWHSVMMGLRFNFGENKRKGDTKMCLVTNIQKYSIHDGDGIRTTVFFKGCPLRCAWCHNPETQKWKRQILTNQEKCTGCMECERVCPNGAVRMENGSCNRL